MQENQITIELVKKVVSILEREREKKEINSPIRQKMTTVIKILELMQEDDDCWFTLCPFNYGYIGGAFYKLLERISSENKEIFNEDYFDRVFLYAIRFLREATISLQRKHLFNYEKLFDTYKFDEIWSWFKTLSIDYIIDEDMQRQFAYIQNALDFQILNYYLGGKEFQAMANFDENIKQAEKQGNELEKLVQISRQELEYLIQETNDKADTKIKEVQRLETSLKTYKEGFNFVGLSNGFSKLLEKKENSKNCMFWLLILIGAFIIGTPFIKMVSETKWADITWQQLLIGIGLEFVLIYFFRVILNQYRAVETQIMQLELRLSLCQFIQAYAEYAKGIKANDKDALEKFENLIFSSILSNDNNIPSTFDGMEQVTQLIKELKSKS